MACFPDRSIFSKSSINPPVEEMKNFLEVFNFFKNRAAEKKREEKRRKEIFRTVAIFEVGGCG
ncbi:MAG: hypothetical protein ABJO67_03280 [Pseudoruegeria sp.]